VPEKAQITQERVEYNVFLFDEPPKGSKSLKIFKISLTFRFDKVSNLSKSVVRKIDVCITSEENGESKLTSEENLFNYYYYDHKILDIKLLSHLKKITLNHALLKLSHER
jgi:hypothetical protein